MPDPSTAVTYAAIAADLALVSLLAGIVRKVWPYLHDFLEFLSDWRGEDARPGYARRPGVLERLRNVEDAAHTGASVAEANALAVAAVSAQLGAVAGQLQATVDQQRVVIDAVATLQPNGGSTMRDAINRIEVDTAAAAGRTIPQAVKTAKPTRTTD